MRNRQTLPLQVVHTFTSTGQVALACEDQLEAGHWLWAKITALRGERSRTSLVRTVAAAGGSQPGTTLWRAGKALDWKTQAGFEDGDRLFRCVHEIGLEGVVAKKLSQRYRPGERLRVRVKNRDYWRHHGRAAAAGPQGPLEAVQDDVGVADLNGDRPYLDA